MEECFCICVAYSSHVCLRLDQIAFSWMTFHNVTKCKNISQKAAWIWITLEEKNIYIIVNGDEFYEILSEVVNLFLCLFCLSMIINGANVSRRNLKGLRFRRMHFFLYIWSIFHGCQWKYFYNTQLSQLCKINQVLKSDCRWFISGCHNRVFSLMKIYIIFTHAEAQRYTFILRDGKGMVHSGLTADWYLQINMA